MQLLPVYTGFMMQAVLGVCMQIAGQTCPRAQEQFDIHFNMKMETQCSSTKSEVNKQMVCGDIDKCINEHFQVFFTDLNVKCDIRKPSVLMVNCLPTYDGNPTTCRGTEFKMPLKCTLEVRCSAKWIRISCMTTLVPTPRPQSTTLTSLSESTTTKGVTILVPTSQPPETSTPSTTTSASTTVTSSSESTPSTTTSASTTLTSSSESTTTKEPVSQASTASNTATLVGGVVGGVLVGVVITLVVVVVWWKCRRSEIQDKTKGETHIYTGLAPVGNSDYGAPTAVPDVIQVSQAGRDTSPLPDFRSERQGETSGQDACSQGDYTYIKEVELEEDGGYSLGKGFPNTVSFKDLAKSGIDSGSGQITDTYNRLGGHAVTSTPQTDTYNRIGDERKDGKIIKDSDEMHPSSDYFVLESSPDQEDTYNRLTAGDEPRGQHNNSTYNRIGETDVEHRDGMDQELTSPDYLILEKADIPGTQDDYNRLGNVSSETSSSNLKNTYNRIGDISSEEERSRPSPDYFILEKNEGQGN